MKKGRVGDPTYPWTDHWTRLTFHYTTNVFSDSRMEPTRDDIRTRDAAQDGASDST